MDNFDRIYKKCMDFLDEAGESRGESSLELGELVHELASSHASQVNNNGLESQVKYILTEMGPEGERAIRDAVGAEPVYDQWVTKCPACGQEKLRVREVTMLAAGRRIDLDVPLFSDGFGISEAKYSGKDCSTEDEQVVCSNCGAGFQLFQLEKGTNETGG